MNAQAGTSSLMPTHNPSNFGARLKMRVGKRTSVPEVALEQAHTTFHCWPARERLSIQGNFGFRKICRFRGP
jgi:hypothetical protein